MSFQCSLCMLCHLVQRSLLYFLRFLRLGPGLRPMWSLGPKVPMSVFCLYSYVPKVHFNAKYYMDLLALVREDLLLVLRRERLGGRTLAIRN